MNNVTNEMLLEAIKSSNKTNLISIIPGFIALLGVIITLIIQQYNIKKTNKRQDKQDILIRLTNLIRDCRVLINDYSPIEKDLKYIASYDEVENNIEFSEYDYNRIEYILSKFKDDNLSMSKADIKEFTDAVFEVIKETPGAFELFKEDLIESTNRDDLFMLVKPKARKYYSTEEFYQRRAKLIESIQENLIYLNTKLSNSGNYAKLLQAVKYLEDEMSHIIKLRDMSQTLSPNFMDKVDEIETLSKII